MKLDIDMAKFFDRVNHDYLMNLLSERIKDKKVLKLIHRYPTRQAVDDRRAGYSEYRRYSAGWSTQPNFVKQVPLDKLD